MVNPANWLLPEGVEEILPEQAARLEKLRRGVLDNLMAQGFTLVMPPVMEFVDALLTGTGEELDTQTYKFMDQHSQRMLGIRADMTPQIARIDAHYLAQNDVNKLCYLGTVLRTQPDQMGGQRELLQLGAEIFGIAEPSADINIVNAMLDVLNLSGATNITLSIGHVGVYRALLKQLDLSINSLEENRLRDVLLRKSAPDLEELADTFDVTNFRTLLSLQGSATLLRSLPSEFVKNSQIMAAIDEVNTLVTHLNNTLAEVNVHIDLADVAGYRYYTGLKYTAYLTGRGTAIAKGGRYDRIGEQFGRARPATGFSADLKSLLNLSA